MSVIVSTGFLKKTVKISQILACGLHVVKSPDFRKISLLHGMKMNRMA